VSPVTAFAGVCLQDVERGPHEAGKRLLASRLGPVLSKATHPPTYLPLHRLWAQLSLVVIIVLFHGREEDDVARVAVPSGVGWAGTAASVDRVVPVGATVVNMSDHGRFGGPRFAQLDDAYKVWAAYQRAQLKKEKLWKAVVTDRPASGSDDKKADPVVEEWDAMNEAALATIQMSVKPVHLNTVTSVDTAKEAWDALKVMFEARDNAQLLWLMDELSSMKKGDDENIIKFTPRTKRIRDELAMLGSPVDDNALALRVLSGLPSEYGMLRTVLENKDVKLVISDVTAKLLQVEQRNIAGGSSKPAGGVKSQALTVAAPKKPFDKKSVVCYYCDKRGHMKRDCYKRKADEAKGKNKAGGGRRDCGHGGGLQAAAALAYTASAGQPGSNKAHGSTSGSSTWVLDSGATNHMAAGDKGFTVQAAGSGAKVTLANGDKVPIKGRCHVSMDVGKVNTKARMGLAEAMLGADMTSNLLSVRAVDRNSGALVFVGDACYILSDGDGARSNEVLDKASVVGKVNDQEQYVLKVTPVKASANAASTRIAGEAELWHRWFNHLGIENLKRAAKMVDGMPSSVADAERVVGTVCVPCVDGKMVQAPHPRSSTNTTKCALVHTDVGGPLTESLRGSIYFITALEDSTGFIKATPIKTKGMASEVLKTRIKQLETMTGVHVKRVRHDGGKEYLTNDLKAWYEDKGITSEMTAPYKSQKNGKAERVNRTQMERVRAALLDAGAEEELWAEALASAVHVLNRSPKAGLDVTPLEALMGRRPNVSGFRVWGSRACALKPKKQQCKLEARTDVGRFVGYTVGGRAYRILEDGKNKVFERRDVLMEEKPAKADSSGDGSSAGPQLTMTEDRDNNGGMDESMDMLDADGEGGEKNLPVEHSESEDDGDPDSLADDNDDEERQGQNESMLPVRTSTSDVYNAAPGPRRSTRRPAPKVTWREKEPKAHLATGSESATKDGCDLTSPPANEKEARARPDWTLWNQAIKEELADHKKLGTWSTTKGSNKQHKAVKTRFVFDMKHDAEGQKTRYKARLVAQGFNQVPGHDF